MASNRSAVEVPPSPSANGLATAHTVLLIQYCALAFQEAPSTLGLSRRPRQSAMLCAVLKRRRRPPRRVAVALSQLVSGIRYAEGIHLLGTVWACRVYAELLCKAPSQPDWSPVYPLAAWMCPSPPGRRSGGKLVSHGEACHMVVGFTTQTGMHGRLAHLVTSVGGRACSVHRGILQVLRNPRSGGASVGPIEGGE